MYNEHNCILLDASCVKRVVDLGESALHMELGLHLRRLPAWVTRLTVCKFQHVTVVDIT